MLTVVILFIVFLILAVIVQTSPLQQPYKWMFQAVLGLIFILILLGAYGAFGHVWAPLR